MGDACTPMPDETGDEQQEPRPRPQDVQATFCATLVDEWVRCGVEHAVVAPGSRSTPLVLALAEQPDIDVHVHHDERSAAFLAVGLALGGWEPAVLVTTSGTAAAEVHAAVVEAHQAGVPMIVCTADRPPELRDVGAPQTIDQTHLFGRAVRWFHDPGVADVAAAGRWRALASRAYAEATGAYEGPVHVNLPFREPLVGTAGELPPSRGEQHAWRPPQQLPVDPVIELTELADRRGVIVSGGDGGNPELVLALAEALGWPVLADHRSSARVAAPQVVSHADGIARSAAAAGALDPEVIVRLGQPPASRMLNEWLARAAMAGADEIVIAGSGRWVDPAGTASVMLDVSAGNQLARWDADAGDVVAVEGWLDLWRRADDAAERAILDVLGAESPLVEPAVARAVLEAVPDGCQLVVSSSMPVRDLEWYGGTRDGIRVLANRGANGIDGVVSTAVGAAIAGGPTAVLLGDVAFLHDSNGLLGAAQRGIDLVCIVVDNDGGGIFSFLPQRTSVDHERFEQLFGTPHALDLVALARAYGAEASSVESDLAGAITRAFDAGGVHVLVVPSDRDRNVEVHARLNDAIVAAVEGALA